MPSVQSLTITYDALNEYETFSEGDPLTGKVTLSLLKDTTVECLFVKAKGDAEVRWTKRSNDHNYTYSAHKRYFKLKQFLIPKDSNGTVVPKGIHVYKFSFTIPPGSMPSSFKGNHGKIVYKLEAKLSRSWKLDRTVEKDIHFVSKSCPILHSLMSPQVGSTKKEMGLFSSGHTHMDVTVDRSGYAPGETMAIVAKINNSSSREMTPKFSLIKDVVYRANSNTKHESYAIHKMVANCVKSQTERDVRCEMMIPRDQMLTIQNCDLISVEYYLKVYLDISFAFDPEVMLPVVVISPNLAPGHQPGVAAGPYRAGASGSPSNSDFPPLAGSRGPYPVSPNSGSYGYPRVQRYSAPPPVNPDKPLLYAGPRGVCPTQPAHMSRGYSNPVPRLASPYGSPFSTSSSSSVLHPPPPAPTFQPPPTAPTFQPPPTAPTFQPPPPAPTFQPPPTAPTVQPPPTAPTFQPPPPAPTFQPPPIAPTFQPPPYALESYPSPSPSPFNITPTAPTYNLMPSAPAMNTDFLSQSDEAPPAYSLLFPSATTDTSDAK